MQTQFTEKELGDCLELVIDHRGKTPKKLGADWIDAGIPTISAKNVNGGRLVSRDSIRHVSLEVYKRWMREDVKRGDCFLVSEGATLGECMLWDYDYPIVLGQRIFCLRANPAVLNPRFLYAYMTSRSFQDEIIGRATGTSVDGLRQTEVLKLKLRLPPIEQQELIGDVLYNLDHKIELNRRMNATLEAMARALFQSWFVDFDPVRAKLDGRPPAALDPATAALFPEHLEDSSLGHIPKGWTATTLGACIGFRCGFSFKSQDWQESGVPVVKIGSVKPGIIDLTQVSYVSEEIAQQAARYRLSTGDMLIGMTGYVGEVGLVPPSDNPPLLNQRVGRFVMAKPGTESLGFWYCTTRQPEFKAFVEARSHGTAQANVSGESIMEFPLVVPPSGILDAFNRECQPLLDRILSNHGESRTLATLRDTLLPKLLSGELSVNEREAALP
jgi:type I restriction enzyme S subunit